MACPDGRRAYCSAEPPWDGFCRACYQRRSAELNRCANGDGMPACTTAAKRKRFDSFPTLNEESASEQEPARTFGAECLQAGFANHHTLRAH